ncbi:MAG: hypothetical protein WC389_15575 [Lutibacter sp.]|jgi:hypothetical protein
MRIKRKTGMKGYPTIQGSTQAPHMPCIAFYKYDGSNLRWEWNKKRGWYKFGTRTRLFDFRDEDYGEAIPLFLNGLALDLEYIFKSEYRNLESAVAFTEFWGKLSFAGKHIKGDTKFITLIDIAPYKKGIISPWDFVKIYGGLSSTAQFIYEGILSKQFIDDIRNNKYPVNEGVVCKGVGKTGIWMAKIKTYQYLTKLKEMYANDWQKYWE